MSVFGALYSGVSGLVADSQWLGMIADNISNSNTPAYKETSAVFSTLVTQDPTSTTYTPGGVQVAPFTAIDQQGLLQAASSGTDLAIQGGGFFVVNNNSAGVSGNGTSSFTRAGSFTIDANGNLKNAAGLFLQGQALTPAQSQAVANGNADQLTATSLSSLQTVNINGLSGTAQATSSVTVAANLPASDTSASTPRTVTVPVYDSQGGEHDLTVSFSRIATAGTPSTDDFSVPAGAVGGDTLSVTIDGNTLSVPNVTAAAGAGKPLTASDVATAVQTALSAASAPLSGFTATTSGGNVRITDPAGNALTASVSDTTSSMAFTSVASAAGTPAGTVSNQWQVAANFTNAGASTATLPSGNKIVFNSDGTINLNSSTFTGIQVNWDPSITGATSPQTVTFNVGSNGQANGLSQFGGAFSVSSVNQNGFQVGNFTGVSINPQGIVTASFDNGQQKAIYILPIATFANANGLAPQTGNTYLQTDRSGAFILRQAGTGAAGSIAPSSLESSTVDIATEFSNLIVAQNAYGANAKVITTADQMLQTLLQAKQ